MISTLARPCEVEHILLDADLHDRRQLFTAIGQVVSQNQPQASADIAQRLDERESLGSTGLGHGVAIPHARMDSLSTSVALLVRTAEPILFDAPDDKPVDLFFVVLVPEQATQEHLQRLADAARLLSERRVREALRTSVSIAAVCAVLRDEGLTS
ncbi:MAG: PTS sugar transporter subunit IIA [Paludibacterium sp.]|uniref:PTS sugar transporter subunit IIA n=1 Tax=Paludibacterium sp. TaxID=1917523 RepID=UPI0025D4BA22|nr:PTS sugar transporter subunit IIA [Paludibacterium sp.]MBV8045770.1 PTS sugar transporter subunit IIA [Paludibacterium sp.]MBV8649250.1 PTS sugar transporter subunit IIA [Paludibacterium sp.]